MYRLWRVRGLFVACVRRYRSLAADCTPASAREEFAANLNEKPREEGTRSSRNIRHLCFADTRVGDGVKTRSAPSNMNGVGRLCCCRHGFSHLRLVHGRRTGAARSLAELFRAALSASIVVQSLFRQYPSARPTITTDNIPPAHFSLPL